MGPIKFMSAKAIFAGVSIQGLLLYLISPTILGIALYYAFYVYRDKRKNKSFDKRDGESRSNFITKSTDNANKGNRVTGRNDLNYNAGVDMDVTTGVWKKKRRVITYSYVRTVMKESSFKKDLDID